MTTPIATMELSNGYESCLTHLTVAPGSMLIMLNMKSYYSEEAAVLVGLLEGQLVKMRLFGTYNMMFYVTEEQIESGAEKARTIKEPLFSGEIFEKRVRAFKERFRDGKLSMSITPRFIVESLDVIEERMTIAGMLGEDTGYA